MIHSAFLPHVADLQSVHFSAIVSQFDTQFMSELDEINLRLAQKSWQAKQNTSGAMTMVTCATALCGFVYFLSSPSEQSATVLVACLVVLMMACVRMVSCAAKVVEARNTLQPAPIRAEVIDVEVVEPYSRPQPRQISQYSGSRY